MKILLADDDQRIVQLLLKALRKENFAVDTAMDGKSAFEKAKSKKYEVILLDIMMPGKSGFDVITSLRSLGIDTPILVISARSMVKDKIYAINSGADDYLVKTFSLEELIARIKSMMRRSAKRGTNVLHCDDLVLNLSDMTAHRGTRPIYLSKKEFGLLHLLLKKKNCIITRDELTKSIWEKSEEKLPSNTLDVHIRFLREKIGLPTDAESMIQTFRGQGYMLRSQMKK